MVYFKNRLFNFLKFIFLSFVVLTLSNICGCHQGTQTQNMSKKQKMPAQNHKQLWSRIRDNYHLVSKDLEAHQQPQIQKYVKHYAEKEKTLTKMSIQATPYLFHIVEALEQREMPGE